MSTPSNCCNSCDTPTTVNIPGSQGQSAFTDTAASFVVPAVGNDVTITVLNTDWMAVGEPIFIEGAGTFEVVTIVDATHVTVEYLDIDANTAAGNAIASGTIVTPTGTSSNGTNGVNAFTVTTADFVVPAIGATVAITVGNSSWITIGQNVFVEDAGYFEVTAKSDSTHFTGQYLDVADNTHATENIVAGAGVSPSGADLANPLTVSRGGTGATGVQTALNNLGVGTTPLSVYAGGTAYSFTNAAALLNFGTTDPSLTISAPGIYLIFARVRVDLTAATFAAVRNLTLKLRRTNNTAADITNSSMGAKTPITTTETFTMGIFDLQPLVYTTTNSDDVLEIWGGLDTVPSAGSLDAVEASIVAVRIRNQTL